MSAGRGERRIAGQGRAGHIMALDLCLLVRLRCRGTHALLSWSMSSPHVEEREATRGKCGKPRVLQAVLLRLMHNCCRPPMLNVAAVLLVCHATRENGIKDERRKRVRWS